MTKQNIKRKIIDHLIEEKRKLLFARDQAKTARDNAPSAMESHSDTSRSENEKLVFALDNEIKVNESCTTVISNTDLICFNLVSDNAVLKVVIVPEGMGGSKVGDMMLISGNSPLGLKLIGKSRGDKLEFNGVDWIVG